MRRRHYALVQQHTLRFISDNVHRILVGLYFCIASVKSLPNMVGVAVIAGVIGVRQHALVSRHLVMIQLSPKNAVQAKALLNFSTKSLFIAPIHDSYSLINF